jgi:hypothetical protein
METLEQRVLGARRLTAAKFYQKALKGEIYDMIRKDRSKPAIMQTQSKTQVTE